MGTSKDPFDGMRGSDLRFDNPHILAEYITRAHRFAESATRIEESAERLLQGAVKTTEEGVRQFQTALRQMKLEFAALKTDLRGVITAAGIDIARGVADAHESGAKCITFYGQIAKASYDGLASRADEINMAAERLEKAAEKAESSRQHAHEEFEQLRAFKSELTRFEKESMTRISIAEARLFQGVGFCRRVWYVPFPPVPVAREIKMPIRPSAPVATCYKK
jgi:hypothetical protein